LKEQKEGPHGPSQNPLAEWPFDQKIKNGQTAIQSQIKEKGPNGHF
jgi:hypothetical protein